MDGPLVIAAVATAAWCLGLVLGALEAALRELGDAWLQRQAGTGGSVPPGPHTGEGSADSRRPPLAGAADRATAASIFRTRDHFAAVCLSGQVLGGVVLGAAVTLLWASAQTLSSPWHWAACVAGLGLGAMLYGATLSGVRVWARRRAGVWVLQWARWLRPITWALWALAIPLDGFRKLVASRLPERGPEERQRITEMGLEDLIEGGRREGGLADEHADLLQNVLEFKNTVAHEVMVPRTRIVAFERTSKLTEVFDVIIKKGHSRYPVYRDTTDNVVGVLYVKDLFAARQAEGADDTTTVGELCRKHVFYAAEGQKIGSLLREMQSKRVHLAIVVDEFGGTSGIVTLEDILEEIVGDIRDEYDRELGPVLQVAADRYIVDAGVSVSDLSDQYQVDLLAEQVNRDVDSVGGLLVDITGSVPTVGAKIELGEYVITIRDSDAKHVRRVEIARRL